MIIAATNPTIPASPKPCTRPIIFSATPPTNGTFPPSRETTIPSPSKEITTLVKLVIVPVNPCNTFMLAPFVLFNRIKSSIIVKLYSLFSCLTAFIC